MVRRGGLEPPPALQLGSDSLGLSADSRMGGDSATWLRSNAAPHHTLYFLIELIIISTPSIAETLSTPPIEAATDAITVTLAPKLEATGNFVQLNTQAVLLLALRPWRSTRFCRGRAIFPPASNAASK